MFSNYGQLILFYNQLLESIVGFQCKFDKLIRKSSKTSAYAVCLHTIKMRKSEMTTDCLFKTLDKYLKRRECD